MYIALTIFLMLILLCVIIFHFRKKSIIKKICSMTPYQRLLRLNEITEPFGYLYDPRQKIFSNTENPWQKDFGYGAIYDRLAPYFGMVFHCLPIYFDYDGKTWLLEFWKGQYGINIGCEAGLYCADKIIPKSMRAATIFKAASPKDCLLISTELVYENGCIARLKKRQWWLTIFSMGLFAKPEQLTMQICVTFPNTEMQDAFLDGLVNAGYTSDDYFSCCTTVCLSLKDCYPKYNFFKRIYCHYVLWKNHIFCRLYALVTRPFTGTVEKLLYMYYYLPFVFRRIFQLKKFKKHQKYYCQR